MIIHDTTESVLCTKCKKTMMRPTGDFSICSCGEFIAATVGK